MNERLGGAHRSGSITVIALRRFGHRRSLASQVGDDAHGCLIRHSLAPRVVDTRHLHVAGFQTALAHPGSGGVRPPAPTQRIVRPRVGRTGPDRCAQAGSRPNHRRASHARPQATCRRWPLTSLRPRIWDLGRRPRCDHAGPVGGPLGAVDLVGTCAAADAGEDADWSPQQSRHTAALLTPSSARRGHIDRAVRATRRQRTCWSKNGVLRNALASCS